MRKLFYFLFFTFYFNLLFGQSRTENFKMILHDDWRMQCSLTEKATGDQVSKKNFPVQSWYKITVPSTFVAGLLANHEYDFDPFYSKNFEKLADKRMDTTWWYRKEFTFPASEKNKNVVLKLHGINYKANVWLNGVLIADSSYIKGPFRIIELDITKQINYTGENVLALEILRPLIQTNTMVILP
jgi:exo-1,4-beta-D-glucosaminidase